MFKKTGILTLLTVVFTVTASASMTRDQQLEAFGLKTPSAYTAIVRSAVNSLVGYPLVEVWDYDGSTLTKGKCSYSNPPVTTQNTLSSLIPLWVTKTATASTLLTRYAKAYSQVTYDIGQVRTELFCTKGALTGVKRDLEEARRVLAEKERALAEKERLLNERTLALSAETRKCRTLMSSFGRMAGSLGLDVSTELETMESSVGALSLSVGRIKQGLGLLPTSPLVDLERGITKLSRGMASIAGGLGLGGTTIDPIVERSLNAFKTLRGMYRFLEPKSMTKKKIIGSYGHSDLTYAEGLSEDFSSKRKIKSKGLFRMLDTFKPVPLWDLVKSQQRDELNLDMDSLSSVSSHLQSIYADLTEE